MAGFRVSGPFRPPILPPWLRRGTLRVPGADLRKLPIGLDFGNISVAEGLRAAVASGAVLVVNIAVQSPALLFAAFAANLTCFCDTGGPLRDRIPALVGFTLIGAALWSGFGLLHDLGLAVLLPVAALVVFCNSMARVWGVRAQAVGNVMTVVLALAVDRPLTLAAAGVLFVSFIAGGRMGHPADDRHLAHLSRPLPLRGWSPRTGGFWHSSAAISSRCSRRAVTSSSPGKLMRARIDERCGTPWKSPAWRSSMRCGRPVRSRRSQRAIC